jgi:hypothetical protein
VFKYSSKIKVLSPLHWWQLNCHYLLPRFIRGFGQVAAPITSLLKGGPVRLQWSAGADRAFGHLKALFTSAPVLAHPDPSSTYLSQFQCVLGYQPVLAPWHQNQIEAPVVDEWFRDSAETWDTAHVRLQQAIRRQKASADRHRSEAPVYALGDRVWLSSRNLPLRLPCR